LLSREEESVVGGSGAKRCRPRRETRRIGGDGCGGRREEEEQEMEEVR